ncbi:MAG: DUF447 family protein [Hyphomicrobiaceae bacterium]|nr:DUF447 family protein [Hyphomicrobiaceae bacterium]
MPKIIETIVTTSNAAGEVHIAPLGLIVDGEAMIVAPFKPSRSLDNLRLNPFACASHTDDVRVFAGGVTGRKSWPLTKTANGQGARLQGCVSHTELAVTKVIEDADRPRFVCRVETHEQHRPWHGWNRAQSAVIEGAILVSRLHMLPAEKIESEVAYLEIAISKTAGPVEIEAWGWLMERVEEWRRTSRQGVLAR